MPVLVWLAAASVSAAVPLLWWSLSSSRVPSHAVARNLTGGRATVADVREAVLTHSASERVVRPLMALMAHGSRRLTPAGFLASLERRVILAGLQAQWPLERVLAAKLLLSLAGLGLGTLALSGSGGIRTVLLYGVIITIGFFAPDVILYGRARERQATIQRELPDTLDQMTISVEAGLGFESALTRVARNGHGPLAAELMRTLQEIQVGVDRTSALRRLAARSDVSDLRQFVTAVLQAQEYGIPVARVLRVQADELRTKRSQRAEEAAMKLPVKVVFPLILCILPALFVVIMGPAVIRVSQTLFGNGGLGS